MVKPLIKKIILKISRFLSINIEVSRESKIGEKTIVENGCLINGETEIGKYSYIGKNTYITKTNIGNYCSIASGVKIGQGEHDIYKISTSTHFYKDPFNELTAKECIIGNDVWIGTNAVILRGVEIGNGAIIGAGSIVTKSIPEFAIAVGAPAKIIKYRFNKETIDLILKSNYWDFDIELAKKKIKEIENSINPSK